MIIDKEVIVKPNNHSIKHYIDKGYDAKCKCELLVKVEDLTTSSNVRVNCKCENCNEITNIKYHDYSICLSKNNFYVCKKCKFEKIKITNKEKYGDENYSNCEKRNKTMIDKYGSSIPLKNINIKNKKEQTCLEKYGFKNASENDEIKNKIKNSHIMIYQDDDNKNKIVDKRRKTCILKYGVDSFTKTEEYKQKSEKTCSNKYGYLHNGSVPEFILKRQETHLKNNVDDNRTDFYLYKRKVNNYTRIFLKELFYKWNGFDYYDNEYIKNNLSYDSGCSLYPSVDHKIPKYFGFKNNIDPKIIGDINNLCITKRSINSKKKDKIYDIKLLIKMKLIIISDIIKKES